jgi:hypothetical protein
MIGDLRGRRSAALATKVPLGSTKAPVPSIGAQTGQFGRSEAKAKLHRLGTGSGSENDRSELRSNSRARPRELGPRAACSTTTSEVSLIAAAFHRAEGPKRLLGAALFAVPGRSTARLAAYNCVNSSRSSAIHNH